LVNLDDPDESAGRLKPGLTTGFVVLEVEERVVCGGREWATSRITCEFEVWPKCFGISLRLDGHTCINHDSETDESEDEPLTDLVARATTSRWLW
jgi:hypothetical protein